MSQRQEELKARMWEKHHKAVSDAQIAELQKMKLELEALDSESELYKEKNGIYDKKRQEAEDYFMKYHE